MKQPTSLIKILLAAATFTLVGTVAAGCGTEDERTVEPGSEAVSGGGGAAEPVIPDGVYRAELTVDDFLDGGVDEAFAHENAGQWTLTFDGGQFSTSSTDESGRPTPDCEGTVSAQGRRVALSWLPGTPCTGDVTARVELGEDGYLRFEGVDAALVGDEVLWSVKPWKKIE